MFIDLNADTRLTISSAGTSLPFLQKYRSSLGWLLDIAEGAAPDRTAAIGRLRAALRELAAGGGARVDTRDLKLALAILLAAIERDLGPVLSRAPLRFPPLTASIPAAPRSRVRGQQLAINLAGNAEWGLALGAGDWFPLFQRYQPDLDWLLEVAASGAAQLKDSRQREAIARVRAAFRRLGAHAAAEPTTQLDRRDLLCVVTLVLVALERDLGRVPARPKGRFRADTIEESFVVGFAELFGKLTSTLA